MADLKLTYRDATIDVNAGLGGVHWASLTCRGRTQRFAPEELNTALMAILYPALDAWAKGAENAPTSVD
jgi:hypothetical protein